MIGPRASGRNPLVMAFCTTVTSLVILVTMPLVSNRSRFVNEKRWMRANCLSRSSWPSFVLDLAAKRAYSKPVASDSKAHAIIPNPRETKTPMSLFTTPWSMMSAISNGISTSKSVSIPTKKTASAKYL